MNQGAKALEGGFVVGGKGMCIEDFLNASAGRGGARGSLGGGLGTESVTLAACHFGSR